MLCLNCLKKLTKKYEIDFIKEIPKLNYFKEWGDFYKKENLWITPISNVNYINEAPLIKSLLDQLSFNNLDDLIDHEKVWIINRAHLYGLPKKWLFQVQKNKENLMVLIIFLKI